MSRVPGKTHVFEPATAPGSSIAAILPDLNEYNDQQEGSQCNSNNNKNEYNEQQEGSQSNSNMKEEDDNIFDRALAREGLLPKESKQKYLDRYEAYKKVLKKNNLDIKEQDSALIWAETQRAIPIAPTTMYSVWSSIKCCLTALDDIPANNWDNVKKWLKQYKEGVFPKQAPLFTARHVERFMRDAPNGEYIRHKLALGLGLQGRLRASEYTWLYHNKDERERIIVMTSKLFVSFFVFD